MSDFLEALGIINFLVFGVGLLLLGYIVGKARELAHLKDLSVRETHFAKMEMMISDLRTLPAGWMADEGVFVGGQAVIASDQFKRFIAGLRKLVGGHVGTYERIMNRARREATLRMMEQAESRGCNVIWCFRQETSTIGGGPTSRGGGVMAEVYVYGTAYRITGAA
ncbi:YbjQ family protein [Gemmatimonadota bacterium]